MLSNNGPVYAACAVHDTIFSTGGKFQPVSNFTELHALTVATRSYVLLIHIYRTTSFTLQLSHLLACRLQEDSKA